MKTKFLSLAIAAVTFSSLTSFAQPDNGTTAEKASTATRACNTRDRKAYNPFEGINLTPDQQAKIEALKADRKKAADTNRAERQKKREISRAERRAARKADLDKMKAILTPEQYVTYLENIALSSDGRKGFKMHGGHMAHNGKKDGNRNGKHNGQRRSGKKGPRQQQNTAAASQS